MIYKFALQKRMRTESTHGNMWLFDGISESAQWDLIKELEIIETYPNSPSHFPFVV